MTLSTIYIARHGYRSNWLPPPHPPNPTGIDSDPSLAPHGVDQAAELAAHIQSLPKDAQPQMIVSSPFYRCVQTSQPIARALGVKVAVDRGVGEWFKTDRDIVPVPAGYEQLGEHFPDVIGSAELWAGAGVVPSSSGETEEDIFRRCQAFWPAFFARFEQQHPAVQRVMFVTHAATKIALGMALLQRSSVHDGVVFEGEKTTIQSGACSLDKYTREGAAWALRENGRTDFLSGGEEMNWNFSVQFEAGSDADIRARKAAQARAAADGKAPASAAKVPPEQAAAEDAFEDIYVAIDVPAVAPSFYEDAGRDRDAQDDSVFSSQVLINPSAKLQVTELDHDTPLFKISDNASAAADPQSTLFSNLSAIDGQIYKTSWQKLLGTELIFDDYGELVGTVREHLVTDSSVRIKPVAKPKTETEDETTEDVDTRTAFLKRAVGLARTKN